MRSSTSLLVLILFLTLMVSSLPVYAHGAVDQKQESFGAVVQILSFSPVGQEFVPSKSPLLAVDVLISCMNPDSGADTLTVNIRKSNISGTILGSSSLLQGVFDINDPPRWYHFDLPSPVNLTLGSTYVIELVATKPTFGWAKYGVVGEDLYPLGRGIYQGSPNVNMDWAFRTYAPSPLGGSVFPMNTVEVLWPWVGLASLAGIVTLAITKKRKLDIKGCRES